MHARVTYLDNAATSFPKPPEVADAVARFIREAAASPGRGGHRLAVDADRLLADVRAAIARLFRIAEPRRVIFTLNATDALNMAIKGAVSAGDHVITTVLDHNSVSRPLEALVDAGMIALTRIACGADGVIDPRDVAAAWTPRTRLVAMTHASNVLGTLQPAAEVGRIVRERDGLLLLDAAQSAGVVEIDVEALGVDLLAAPRHKALLGPTGTGFLYAGPRADLHAWREGGTGVDSESRTQPRDFPFWLEAGSANTVGIAGLRASLAWLAQRGVAAVAEHERALLTRLVDALSAERRIRVLGTPDARRRVGTMSLLLDGLSPADAAAALDASFGVAVRAGLHCAPYAHRALGTFPDGALRVSPGPFSSAADIDLLARAILELCEV